MILYIKVEDGNPIDHPVADWNLMEVFGCIPDNYEPFTRTQKPPLGRFETDDVEAVQYARGEDGVWTDLWPSRPMNAEERAEQEAWIMQSLESSRQQILDNVVPAIMALADTDERRAECEAYKRAVEEVQLSVEEDFLFPEPPQALLWRQPSTDVDGGEPDVIG